MIQVKRGEAPHGFAAHSLAWLREFQGARQQNPVLSSSRFWTKVRQRKAMKGYVQQLHTVFKGKCAFCESKMAHVSPAHIEHYRPKGKPEFQDLIFEWDNWLLSCPNCNTNKGQYFDDCDGYPCLIDPASEDPTEHIKFLEAQLLYKTERGKETVDHIKLNRIDLAQERVWWLGEIQRLLLLMLSAPEAKNEARTLLIWTMQDDAPYAAMTRSFLQEKTPKLANPKKTHPFVEQSDQLNRIKNLLAKYEAQLKDIE